jgi:hypothetical protein
MTIIYSDDYTNKSIEIILGEGENEKKWNSEFEICDSPTCNCNDISFRLFEPENGDINIEPKHCFTLDVFDEKPIKQKGESITLKEDFKFAKLFAKNLSKEDWNELRFFFRNYKRHITHSTPLDELNVSFPEKEIEKDKITIGYYEIFPYAEEIWIQLDDINYLLDDQYCLSSKCSCINAVLTFMPIKNGKALNKTNPLTISFNYKKRTWQIENNGPKNIATPEDLVKEILDKNLENTFKERHSNLHILYKNYRKTKGKSLKESHEIQQLAKESGKQEKIGRNAPCPCGSGKKYKKCCMK